MAKMSEYLRAADLAADKARHIKKVNKIMKKMSEGTNAKSQAKWENRLRGLLNTPTINDLK